jgi:hypothetical protein
MQAKQIRQLLREAFVGCVVHTTTVTFAKTLRFQRISIEYQCQFTQWCAERTLHIHYEEEHSCKGNFSSIPVII